MIFSHIPVMRKINSKNQSIFFKCGNLQFNHFDVQPRNLAEEQRM